MRSKFFMLNNTKASILIGALLLTFTAVADISFRVTEKESSHPMAGARVEFQAISADGEALTITGVTSEDGIYSNATYSQGDNPLLVTVRKDGFSPIQFQYLAEGGPQFVGKEESVVLPRSRTVGGSVMDLDGNPVPDINVTVSFPQSLAGPKVPRSELTTSTNSQGEWESQVVPDEVSYVRVEIQHDDFESVEGNPEEVSLQALYERQSVIRVKSLHHLSGTVVDPLGHPVSGARVTIGNQHGIMGLGQDESVETDALGRFKFVRIDGGRRLIAVVTSSWAPAIRDIQVTKTTEPINFQLGEPASLSLEITDHNENPIADAKVTIAQWERFDYPGWEFQTDSEGKAVWTNAPEGTVSIDVSKPGYMRVGRMPVDIGSEEQIIQLGPELRIHGAVVDAQTSEPIPDFSVTPGWPDIRYLPGGESRMVGEQWAQYDKKAYRDGRFDITFDSPVVIGTKKPYDFLLRIESDGYESAVSPVIKADAREAELRFELKKGGDLIGKVLSKEGRPPTDAQGFYSERRYGLRIRNGSVDARFPDVATLTIAADGGIKMKEPTGSATIAILSDEGYAVLESDEFKANPKIVLTPWATIEGTLRLGNHSSAGETVALWFAPTYTEKDGVPQRGLSVFQDYSAECDDQGRFRFDRVPIGEVSVARVLKVQRPRGATTSGNEVWGAQRLLTVDVQSGTRLDVNAGGNGRRIIGQLRIPEEIRDSVDLKYSKISIDPVGVEVPIPQGDTREEKQQWMREWFWSEKMQGMRHWYGGTPYITNNGRILGVHPEGLRVFPDSDGRIHVENVPPGDYALNVMFHEAPTEVRRYNPNFLGSITHAFTVSESSGEDGPINLGDIDKPLVAPRISNGPLMGLPLSPMANPLARAPSLESMVKNIPEPAKPQDQKRITATAGSTLVFSQNGGYVFNLIVRMRILEGHHIYAMGSGTENLKETSLKLELPEGFEATGRWRFSEPVEKSGVKIHQNEVYFRRNIRNSGKVTSGEKPVKCTIGFQICNDMVCWPPSKLVIETTLKIE